MLFKRIACPYLFPLQSRVPQPMRIFMQSIKHMPNFQILKGEHYRIFPIFFVRNKRESAWNTCVLKLKKGVAIAFFILLYA